MMTPRWTSVQLGAFNCYL